jgi:hypothetical protein
MEELPEDMRSRFGYRIAYGEAARLAEIARFDHGWGRGFAAGIGGGGGAVEQARLMGMLSGEGWRGSCPVRQE